jgi:hypothetical protein
VTEPCYLHVLPDQASAAKTGWPVHRRRAGLGALGSDQQEHLRVAQSSLWAECKGGQAVEKSPAGMNQLCQRGWKPVSCLLVAELQAAKDCGPVVLTLGALEALLHLQ